MVRRGGAILRALPSPTNVAGVWIHTGLAVIWGLTQSSVLAFSQGFLPLVPRFSSLLKRLHFHISIWTEPVSWVTYIEEKNTAELLRNEITNNQREKKKRGKYRQRSKKGKKRKDKKKTAVWFEPAPFGSLILITTRPLRYARNTDHFCEKLPFTSPM